MDKTDNVLEELLLFLPQNGSWTSGLGFYTDSLMEVLDAGTPFIEEAAMTDRDEQDANWYVRLTQAGIARRAEILARRSDGR